MAVSFSFSSYPEVYASDTVIIECVDCGSSMKIQLFGIFSGTERIRNGMSLVSSMSHKKLIGFIDAELYYSARRMINGMILYTVSGTWFTVSMVILKICPHGSSGSEANLFLVHVHLLFVRVVTNPPPPVFID